jgi:fibronectin-binding autotransporter adhesin
MGSRHCILACGIGLGLTLALLFGLALSTSAVQAADVTASIFTDQNDGCDVGGSGCSLREAIAAAGSGDTVVLLAGTYAVTLGTLQVDKSLTLQGAGPGVTIIDGAGNSPNGILETGTNPVTFTVAGLTMRNGVRPGGDGGALLFVNDDSRFLITDCVLTGNQSDQAGGAIRAYGDDDRLDIVNSNVIRNDAGNGGGIAFEFNHSTLTIVNTTISTNTAAQSGGGISALTPVLTITLINSTMISNTAGNEGGGIYLEDNERGRLLISNSTVSRNHSGDEAGGIRIRAKGMQMEVVNSQISHNVADWAGGGIRFGCDDCSASQLMVSHSTIDDNDSGDKGGGIRFAYPGGAMTIADSVISNNRATFGGGIAIDNEADQTLQVTDSAILSNTAEGNANSAGGGVYFNAVNTVVTMTNCTVSGNSAASWEGGLSFGSPGSNSTIHLNNVTIAHNHAGNDAGGLGINTNDVAYIANSLIAGNTDGGSNMPDCGIATGADFHFGGYNLVGNKTGCGWTAATGDQQGTGAVPIDPMLGALQGSPAYHPLLVGSPAINAANPAAPGGAYPACAPTDQRGVARPQGPRCDIGAYEYSYAFNYLPIVVRH